MREENVVEDKNDNEDRYLKLQQDQWVFQKKTQRVEQARRNIEALNKLFCWVETGGYVDMDLMKESISTNLKIMNEVSSL